MSRRPILTGLFAALFVTTACEAQPVTPAAAESIPTSVAAATGAQEAPRGPIAHLLAQREALGLSDEQVARLTAIQARLEEQTAPLREQLRGIVGERPEGQRGRRGQLSQEEREAMRARMQQARPVMEQLRESTRAGFQEARGVLTAEQVAKLRELRPGRGQRGPRGQRPGRGR